ncbi:MAG: S9 family peptidase [Pseudomonadota bacterium]
MHRLLFAFLMLVVSGPAFAEPELKQPTLDDFLAGDTVDRPRLSPSGDKLALINREQDRHGEQFVSVIDLNDVDAAPDILRLGPFWVNWVYWANDERILVSLTGYKDMRSGDLLSVYEDLPPRSLPIVFSRVVAMDPDGTNSVPLFSEDRRIQRNLGLSRIASFLPNDPDHVIMPARLRNDLDLFKVNVNDGTEERIAVGTARTYDWYVDQNGEPAFRYNVNRRGTVITIFAREERRNGQIRWKRIRTIRLNRENERREAATEFLPLSPGQNPTTYYVAARPEGEDTAGIYLYDFETDAFVETIAQKDGVDIVDALFDRETGAYLGVYYWEHRLVMELQDPAIQAHIDGLNTYFGEQANVIPIDSSENGRIWVIEADGPTEPGTFHVYDTSKAFALGIAARRIELIGKQLSPTQVIDYVARDGLMLSGYLTRPAEAAPTDRPPLIVMPHGGPEARDYITFDPLVQYLASRGYQVFQPNFRGSSGFGKIFADRGRLQYGKAMQTDVDDGFAHLVNAGLADADRACIYGYSYGGYVAMAAATLTPDLYQCVIAGAGLSDLVEMLDWERRQEGSDSEAYQYWVAQIGDPRRDRDALEAVSPALMADRVTAPLLLIHGAQDDIVPIEQSEFMRDAMAEAGREVEFLRLEEAGHSYRNDEEHRLEYETVTRFLETHLPVGVIPMKDNQTAPPEQALP